MVLAEFVAHYSGYIRPQSTHVLPVVWGIQFWHGPVGENPCGASFSHDRSAIVSKKAATAAGKSEGVVVDPVTKNLSTTEDFSAAEDLTLFMLLSFPIGQAIHTPRTLTKKTT